MGERPPSRGKGAGGVNATSPGQVSLDWARIMEENEDEDVDVGVMGIGEEVSVMKVPLPAREDVRPHSRDWADPVGGWGVIDGVADGGGGMIGEAGKGKVFLPPVVHEMSVLPVVERVS